jgi:methyl-accepting chemotaxis protein
MDLVTDASRSISEIAVLIDEIAFQTNLLALNAAVEAARAGDQGRGFAVVATEVRSLAQRSAGAAKNIKSLINETVERVSAGSELVRKAGQSLETIQTGATKVSDIVGEIAAASVEQSAGIDQVNDAVTALDQVTQQNAALVEEASAASRQALELTQELVQQMAFFKIAGMAEKAPIEGYSAAVAKVAGPTRHEPARKHAPAKTVPAKEHAWQEF